MRRRRLSCSRNGCGYPRYARKLCAGHYLQEHPRNPPAAKPRPATPRGDGITAETRAIVLARSQDLCEACGHPLRDAVHLHHRQSRRSGDHTPANLLALHPECHVNAPQAVHQRPAWARERGLIVPTWDTPGQAPLVLADGRRVRLHPADPVYLPPLEGTPHAA